MFVKTVLSEQAIITHKIAEILKFDKDLISQNILTNHFLTKELVMKSGMMKIIIV